MTLEWPWPYFMARSNLVTLWNQWTDFHETWYVASLTPAHHSLFKWWSWVDLELFYGKVKFGNLGFSIGKSENCWFFRTFAACDLKLHKNYEAMWILKVKVISWPWPSQLHMKLKTGFSQKPLGQSKPNFICKLSGSRNWKFINMMLVSLPLWNRWTDFHKTWYVALVTPAQTC